MSATKTVFANFKLIIGVEGLVIRCASTRNPTDNVFEARSSNLKANTPRAHTAGALENAEAHDGGPDYAWATFAWMPSKVYSLGRNVGCGVTWRKAWIFNSLPHIILPCCNAFGRARHAQACFSRCEIVLSKIIRLYS